MLEEVLQVPEIVGGVQRLDRVVGKVDAIASGQPKHCLGLDCPFDVQVQLGLRQAFDETRHMCLPGPIFRFDPKP